MALNEIIRNRIKNEGPVSFRDYMEMCLYYPGMGYYTSDRKKIGVSGDFYTSSNVSPAFGAMLGRQIREMWTICGEEDFIVVEYGAGTGKLCIDILDYLANYEPHCFAKVQYYIIEKSPSLRSGQELLLGNKVNWVDSLTEIGKFTGCVISNELVDNFSVHQVVMQEELMEVFVDFEGDFKEILLPADSKIRSYFTDLAVSLPRGFRTEVCVDAIGWLEEISLHLIKGFVVTIDYGYTSGELYSDSRRLGTLVAYHQHKVGHNLFANIGSQDITAHVNFSALALYGHRKGLEFTGYREQGNFLRALGIEKYMSAYRSQVNPVQDLKKEIFALHTLLEDMGTKFKILVQHKGLEKPSLAGFKIIDQTI